MVTTTILQLVGYIFIMIRKRTRKPEWQVRIAKDRIDRLFDLAKESFKKHPERSRRYIELARKIGLRYNIRLTKDQKRSFCKRCNQLLISEKTSSVKQDQEKKLLTVKCLNCNNIYRYPYKKI